MKMKFRKKPVVIEAIKFDRLGMNYEEVKKFVGEDMQVRLEGYFINTLEGLMRVTPGDYVIKGVEGEFYPCKPDIFEKTYEMVED
jgi:hypothetical protein